MPAEQAHAEHVRRYTDDASSVLRGQPDEIDELDRLALASGEVRGAVQQLPAVALGVDPGHEILDLVTAKDEPAAQPLSRWGDACPPALPQWCASPRRAYHGNGNACVGAARSWQPRPHQSAGTAEPPCGLPHAGTALPAIGSVRDRSAQSIGPLRVV